MSDMGVDYIGMHPAGASNTRQGGFWFQRLKVPWSMSQATGTTHMSALVLVVQHDRAPHPTHSSVVCAVNPTFAYVRRLVIEQGRRMM